MRAYPILEPLTVERLLEAYKAGFFPMAEDRHNPDLYWIDPDERGILPLNAFHVPKRLARTVRQDQFRVTCNQAFDAVLAACAETDMTAPRERTWINDDIIAGYGALHRAGHAHSLECWKDGRLAGGLYGVHLGGAFFGESMFSRARDASKVALCHLVARLKFGGIRLLDAQFPNRHLAQFGAATITQGQFRLLLNAVLDSPADFKAAPPVMRGDQVLQLISQTS